MKFSLPLVSFAALASAALLGGAAVRPAQNAPPPAPPEQKFVPTWDTYSDTWVATDALGRELPNFEQVGPPRPNKQVGIFYFLWVDGRSGVVNDNNKVLQKNPDYVFPLVKGAWHWWGEPLFGYYKISDPFVLRKHAQMLRDAGIDALAFDSTNAYLHEEQTDALCAAYEGIRKNGQSTPQFFHVTNAQSGKTVQKVYDEVYGKNRFPDLWFRWNGKPLILAHPAELSAPMNDYFTVRYSWAFAKGSGDWFKDGHDKWPWILTYPQTYGWHTDPETPEETTAAIAFHAHENRGRSLAGSVENGVWKEKEPPPSEQKPGAGIQFDLQWQQARKIDAPFVFVTGWNEWIAPAGGAPGRNFMGHVLNKEQAFFVDEYSPEFSRDAEPSLTEIGDNYYYQLVANVRRYKGVRKLAGVKPKAIKPSGPMGAQFASVSPEFRDDIADPVQRDFDGFAKDSHYENHSGRNDLIAAKMTYDKTNFYFYVRTRAPITTPQKDEPGGWMTLLLDTDTNHTNGWMGYDFAVNLAPPKNGKAFLQSHSGNIGAFSWGKPAPVSYRLRNNELLIIIPRKAINGGKLPATLDFKWADNCFSAHDWTDFTLNGDAAPNDRFNYRATLK